MLILYFTGIYKIIRLRWVLISMLWDPNTTKEIRAAGAAAFRDHSRLQLLLEQWTSCCGVWTQSDSGSSWNKKSGTGRTDAAAGSQGQKWWPKFGSQKTADEIIACKLCDPQVRATQVRAHPDCHGVESEDWGFTGGMGSSLAVGLLQFHFPTIILLVPSWNNYVSSYCMFLT